MGTFLFSIADTLLGKLGSVAFRELSSAWGLESDLKRLELTVSAIKAVLFDAEERRSKNHGVRVWLEQLKDVLYDAEDVIDEFHYQVLRRKVVRDDGNPYKRIGNFFSLSNSLTCRFEMAHRIKHIRERLDDIAALGADFGLTERDEDGHGEYLAREITHSFMRTSGAIGRADDREKILELLLQNDHSRNVSIISIFGIGGVGKTELSKLIFNDPMVAMENFHSKIWVCVSDDFKLEQLMMKIIEAATGEKCADLVADQLQRRVRDNLDGKKFFLVLDDVWNEDRKKWKGLEDLLMGGAKGSKILVTTRSSKVASIVGDNVYKLNVLSEGYCLSLFKKWAFREGDENRYPHLVRIGSDIVRKCGGIPLAVKTLASLLFSTTDQRDWIYIRDNEIWQLPQKDNDILPALKLSYDQMCLLLKQCFSLLSIFPKDYLISREFLIQLWSAHGLLKPSNGREDLEDIGSRYVNELYSRSFIQDFYDFGRISCFQVHDLVHDLACSVAENECFVMDTEIKSIPEKVRHLSFSSYSDLLGRHVINTSLNPERVRTIFFLTDNCTFRPPTKWFIDQCISKFKHLRLLDLVALSITELPSSIGSLKHLRHLDLSLNKIKRLPDSINKLKHLQMLGLYDCSELEQLPEQLCNMISLRVLGFTSKQMQLPQIGVGCLSSFVDLRVFRCHNIEYLFEGMQNLFALRTLDIKYCRNLLTLPRALKFLPALETLLINRCEKITLEMDEEEDRQLGWSQLRTLTMKYLPSLITFSHWFQGSSSSLQNLSIVGCPEISELPEWLSDLKSIEKIEIFNSPKLKSLPRGMDGVTSLRKLLLGECPILSERCKRESGDDWLNIAHISEVYIDGQKISTNAI